MCDLAKFEKLQVLSKKARRYVKKEWHEIQAVQISIPFNLLTAIWSLKSSLIERAEIIPCFATLAVAINST